MIQSIVALSYNFDNCGVSMLTSSLTPEELPLGIAIGGGVLIRSSKVFQKPNPPEFLMAWLVNVLEDERLLTDCSLLIVRSSGLYSRTSD